MSGCPKPNRCRSSSTPPNTESHGKQQRRRLLMCREGDYVQQQRIAMKLSRMAGGAAGSPYLWWAVTSQLLQARAAAAGALGCAAS